MSVNINIRLNLFKPRKKIKVISLLLVPIMNKFRYINAKTWCVGGKHYSNNNNITKYEKINPRTKN